MSLALFVCAHRVRLHLSRVSPANGYLFLILLTSQTVCVGGVIRNLKRYILLTLSAQLNRDWIQHLLDVSAAHKVKKFLNT